MAQWAIKLWYIYKVSTTQQNKDELSVYAMVVMNLKYAQWKKPFTLWFYLNRNKRADKTNLRWKKLVVALEKDECWDWFGSCIKDLSGMIEISYILMGCEMQVY